MALLDWSVSQIVDIRSGASMQMTAPIVDFPNRLYLENDQIFKVLTSDSLKYKFSIIDENDVDVDVELLYFSAETKRMMIAWKTDIALSDKTRYYLAYDSGHADNPSVYDAGGIPSIWSSGYRMSTHMVVDPSTAAPQLPDSVGVYNGTSNGAMTTDDLGIWSDSSNKSLLGIEFDGIDDYFSCGTPSMSLDGEATWSIMLLPATGGRIIGKHQAGNFGFEVVFTADGEYEIGVSSDGTAWEWGRSASYGLGSWLHMGLAWNGSEISIYNNGYRVDAPGPSVDFPLSFISATINTTAQDLQIGNNQQYTANKYAGVLNHTSVSNVDRSPSWMRAEAMACFNLTVLLAVDVAIYNAKKVWSRLLLTGSQNGTVDVYPPCTNFQATRREGGQTSLVCTIPDTVEHGQMFVDRPDGDLVIENSYLTQNDKTLTYEIVRVPLSSVHTIYGGVGSSIQSGGNIYEEYLTPDTKTLPGVNYTSVSPAGNINIRMNALMPSIRPGDTVTYKNTSGGDESIVVRKISMSVSADTQIFNMTE